MVMVGVAFGSLQADSQPGQLAWSEGRRPLGAVPHSSYEPVNTRREQQCQRPCGPTPPSHGNTQDRQWTPTRHDLKSAPWAGRGISLREVVSGYWWSMLPYSVLFSSTPWIHLMRGFLHPPPTGHAPMP